MCVKIMHAQHTAEYWKETLFVRQYSKL